MVLEKTLESPLDSKEIKPVKPEFSLEGLMLKLKLQYFAIAHRHAALPAHCGAGVCSRDLLSRCLVGGQIQYEGLRHLCARLSAPPSSRAPSVSGFDCFQLPSVFLERGSSVPVKKGGRLIDHWLS